MKHPNIEDQRGWTRIHPNTRNRLNAYGSDVRRGQLGHRNSTRALTKLRVIQPATLVTLHRRKPLRAGITSYIDVSDRVGLNSANVANLYRIRDNTGLGMVAVTTEIVTTDTWASKG